ncbi:Uncharacterized Golgi apparatus membrane protein-like protein CG5021 [Eumeta japonica]|uniref:Golgi apparatus membrane protein TVP23 homolog n=1 Tax=Eumeta variegata TaxID=151549 RepID=A0A4C1YJD9_EUMVA|nr:Uncharacterized Golgi apparatus membrane protein-like protein CG5021 [Eumeta japonica]
MTSATPGVPQVPLLDDDTIAFGRLLVGLRWWNYVDDDGKSHWVFEAKQLVVLIALTLNGANLYGYIKCKFGAKENLTSATTDFVKRQILQNATSFFTQPAPPTTGRTGVV